MFDFLKKKKEVDQVELKKPIEGKIITVEEVPDPVFSQKMVGDGFAIDPQVGKVYSPVNGEVVLRPEQLHAVGIRAENGAEILIHFGMDTVELNGEGFTSHVEEGDKVEQGDLILEVDLDFVKGKVPSTITPVIITNPDDFEWDKVNDKAELNETVTIVRKK